MLAKDYITTLETNAMILGILAISMKDFATQIIREIHKSGTYDDAAFAGLRQLCIQHLKDIGAEGVPLEQEAMALNQALLLFQQMMDDAVKRGRA